MITQIQSDESELLNCARALNRKVDTNPEQRKAKASLIDQSVRNRIVVRQDQIVIAFLVPITRQERVWSRTRDGLRSNRAVIGLRD
jgi:hypothetical protein